MKYQTMKWKEIILKNSRWYFKRKKLFQKNKIFEKIIKMNVSINKKENNRKLDENLDSLENQLNLIKALMDQITLNLDNKNLKMNWKMKIVIINLIILKN